MNSVGDGDYESKCRLPRARRPRHQHVRPRAPRGAAVRRRHREGRVLGFPLDAKSRIFNTSPSAIWRWSTTRLRPCGLSAVAGEFCLLGRIHVISYELSNQTFITNENSFLLSTKNENSFLLASITRSISLSLPS